MATSSKETMSFRRHTRDSEIEGLFNLAFGAAPTSPKAQTRSISSPSIQLSLGGVLSSRAHLCFTGQPEAKSRATQRQTGQHAKEANSQIPGRLFDLRQRMPVPKKSRRLFSLRQQAHRSVEYVREIRGQNDNLLRSPWADSGAPLPGEETSQD